MVVEGTRGSIPYVVLLAYFSLSWRSPLLILSAVFGSVSIVVIIVDRIALNIFHDSGQLFSKVGRRGSGLLQRILDWLFPNLAGGSRSRGAKIGRLRLTLAHLDSPKAASKAAPLTFPNRNRFSSCQDWRVIISCCLS